MKFNSKNWGSDNKSRLTNLSQVSIIALVDRSLGDTGGKIVLCQVCHVTEKKNPGRRSSWHFRVLVRTSWIRRRNMACYRILDPVSGSSLLHASPLRISFSLHSFLCLSFHSFRWEGRHAEGGVIDPLETRNIDSLFPSFSHSNYRDINSNWTLSRNLYNSLWMLGQNRAELWIWIWILSESWEVELLSLSLGDDRWRNGMGKE